MSLSPTAVESSTAVLESRATQQLSAADQPSAPSTSVVSKRLSVLMPVYNERYTVSRTIENVLTAPLPDGFERELIVVDDASTDGTGEVLERIARQHEGVIRLVRHQQNTGKGGAVRTAIKLATGEISLIQDADLEYDPRDYPALLQPILDGDADVVYGSRFVPGPRRRVLYFWHALGNKWLTTLSNLFSNLNLTDMETGYKAVRTDILKSIPIRCNRFGLEPELTAKLAKRGCRIYEVAISYRGRTYQEGKKITWWDGVKAMAVIFYFWLVDDIYEEQYGHAILYSLSKTHRFNRWMADRIRPWVGNRVLEIGAGLGNLSTQLLPRDHYTCSDIDALHLDHLKNRFAYRPEVSVKTVDLQDPATFHDLEGKYDTIVCLNVLEHVERDELGLANMYRALAPGGAALILVPQGMWLYGTLDTVLGHCRRYSREELISKCRQAGFHVEDAFCFNRVGVPAWYYNAKILKREHFGKLQLKIFDSMVWLFRRIDRFLPIPGISVIVVARNPSEAPA